MVAIQGKKEPQKGRNMRSIDAYFGTFFLSFKIYCSNLAPKVSLLFID